ncbi:MAG TPA: BBE domain-containing protein [Candidatus Binatia bacterium]|nr:BBE domain-containing protein [Candidatus Binatia bacterium]
MTHGPSIAELRDRFTGRVIGPEDPVRLAAIKARYYPTNLFRLNQNVPPDRSEVTRP